MTTSEIKELETKHLNAVRYTQIIENLKKRDIVHAAAIICQVADDQDMKIIKKIFEKKLESIQ